MEDALRLADIFAARGWSCVLGPWVPPDSTPRENFSTYCSAIDAIIARRLDAYVSIKLSTIDFDGALFSGLLARGRDAGVRVHCDSIGPDTADRTMATVERAAATHPNLGSTVPAGWRRSTLDAMRLAAMGVAVRIVKGQWADPEGPIGDTGRAFIGLAKSLAGKGTTVAVATHDRRVARESLSVLGASATACEMEQISGLPQNCAGIASGFGVPFRVYIPYGYPYLPYNIWQVRTRPTVALWALRDFIVGRHRSVR